MCGAQGLSAARLPTVGWLEEVNRTIEVRNVWPGQSTSHVRSPGIFCCTATVGRLEEVNRTREARNVWPGQTRVTRTALQRDWS